MNITEMIAKRARAWDECKAFLEAHRNEAGILSAEDSATYDTMVATVDAMEAEIKRLQDIEARDASMVAPTSKPITGKIGTLEAKSGRASEEYHKAFLDHIKNKRSVNAALQEDTNSEGGYLVPVEFERKLIDGLSKEDPIFKLATRISMGAHEKNVPIVSNQGDAALISEEGAYTDNGDTFSQVTFKAYKFGRICKASEELISDSAFDIEEYLRNSFSRSIGRCEAQYFWTGTGTSQPQGALTGAETGVTSAAKDKITADEIIDLYYSLPEQYRANASFCFNDSTIKAIRKLKDNNGQYLWQAGLNGQPATILGKPVYTSEFIPAIAAGKKVGVFGDLSYYWIGDRQGVGFLRLNELYAANGQVGFRGNARSDGHVMLADAIKAIVMSSAT